MKLNSLILILLFITVLGCKQNKTNSNINVKQEIGNLNSISEKENFLESIYHSDQNIRNGESSELIIEYGKESSEYQNFIWKMDSIDKLNLKRIDYYLDKFGYPNKDSVSKNARITPWLVIHHSTDVHERKDYFQILKKAYQEGNIGSSQFEMYLERTFQFEKGNYPSWEGAYNPNDKIDWLIKELNLE